jgi:hypothetical protein
MIVATAADSMEIDPYPGFAAACGTLVELSTTGATGGCERLASDADALASCLTLAADLLLSECSVDDALERQICVYDAAVALDMDTGCRIIDRLGDPEMADDCRATITRDPSFCARVDDAALRASCCETFRGTDSYGTCIREAQDSTTTSAHGTSAVTDDTTTTEVGDEDGPPANG